MIVATAGHVDHGKTSLVRTLTGTDTDRLPEEKKRGLTIDIGFAYFRTPTGQSVAMIDVPGHEKFVRNMISGVGLVDIALLVVAADDGPMPQTIEHIAILKLMRVKVVVPVISKIDLVDAERQAQVVSDLSNLLEESKLATTEFFCMSVLDKNAVAGLKNKLFGFIDSIPSRSVHGHFRMAIDRCFTIAGSGTVVTGTVSSGRLEKNETLTLVSDDTSAGKSARVRGIHAQNAESAEAIAGQRCAVNISGELSRDELQRGTWLVANSDSVKTRVIDVALTAAFKPEAYSAAAADHTVDHWTPAHLHLGTADIPCRIALLDCTSVSSGQTVMARLICDHALTAAHGDRFVLRDQSARSTIAGGSVIDVLPPRRGRSKPARLQQLSALNAASATQAMNNLLAINEFGIDVDDFALQFNLLDSETDMLLKEKDLVLIANASGRWCLSKAQSAGIEQELLQALLQQHADKPDQLGVGVQDLYLATARKIKPALIEHHLKALIENNSVVRVASIFRHAQHQISMNPADDKVWSIVENKLKLAELTPLRLVELAEVLEQEPEDTRAFMNRCVAHGRVFKVADNRYFLPQTLRELASIADSLGSDDMLTVAEFRNKSGVGRNLVVELLEYFDRCRFTLRVGNKRKVLNPYADIF